MPAEPTLLRQADWAVLWDPAAQHHVYRRDVDLLWVDDRIVQIGASGERLPTEGVGPLRLIDARRRMVMPGLVDIHAHPGSEPAFRGIREEHGLPGMYMSGLFERSQAFSTADPALRAAATELACCELLLSGVTTLVDIGSIWDGWAELMARSGLRAYLAPGYASARWVMHNDHELHYAWDEAGGRRRMDEALAFIDALPAHPSGRLRGMVSPMQIDTCTAELLRDSLAAAQERGLPFTVHIAQGVSEVLEMLRRHGRTPVQWAAEIGILGPTTTLGHAIFLDSHSSVPWWTRLDLGLLAEHAVTVAHCPTPFARYGQMLESFGRYRRAGVYMGIGTDTTPHNMLEDLRRASSLSRIADRDIQSVSTAELFHAATVGGARALLRDDIGRLTPGAKADLVLVDLDVSTMQPARDPLRSLIFHAADRAVREVFIDGRQVVAGGRVLSLQPEDAAQRLSEAQARMMAEVPRRDYLGRSADQITPLSLPMG
jgi:cytosine/adenosine deaminase-related metal-dependent hydrolase